MSKLYAGIDLHSNNNYLCIIDEQDNRLHEVKLGNNIESVLETIFPFEKELEGIVVESTFNWYWLVDGLKEAGFHVHLANPAKINQYSGLKFSNDKFDAFWLAHLLRLNLLAEGYIYPKNERPIRDLLRKRSQLVRFKTTNILSAQNLLARNTGQIVKGQAILKLTPKDLHQLFDDQELIMALECNLILIHGLLDQVKKVEKRVHQLVKLRPEFQKLLTITGIGKILALTIMLETGEISRFPTVGDFTSYCRNVPSKRTSNGKKKGEGNRKNGNKYLAWAFVEAAHFSIISNEQARRFYQKKAQKTMAIVAIKALASKLSRASYFVMRDQVDFEVSRLFGKK